MDLEKDYGDFTEKPGGDDIPVEEDLGTLPDNIESCFIEEENSEPPYYPSQIVLANKIIERMDIIFDGKDRPKLSDFKNFDFRIYTANTIMLENQTIARVSQKLSGCISKKYYEGSGNRAWEEAKKRVHRYTKTTVEQAHKELLDIVCNEPNTLFLIVADEAHWGVTTKDQANYKLINDWNDEVYKNVFILLVTATPYNLITNNTRIPSKYFIYDDNGNIELLPENNSVRVKSYDVKNIHHIKWNESFVNKILKGIILKLRVPLKSAMKTPKRLYIEPCQEKRLLNWKAMNVDDDIERDNGRLIFEFLVQGNSNNSNRVQIRSYDRKWILVLRGNELGFVKEKGGLQDEDLVDFNILHCFGEDLLVISVSLRRMNYLLTFEENKNVVVIVKEKAIKSLENFPTTSISSSLLIEYGRSSVSAKQYISLNRYINSMRNEKPSKTLIRSDFDFEHMAKKVLVIEDIRRIMDQEILSTSISDIQIDKYGELDMEIPPGKEKTVKNYYVKDMVMSELLIAEYSYYILKIAALNELDQHSTVNSFVEIYSKKIDVFKKRLLEEHKRCMEHNSQEDIYTIRPASFDTLLKYKSDIVVMELQNSCENYKKKKTELNKQIIVESLIKFYLHARSNELKCFIINSNFSTLLPKGNDVKEIFKNNIRNSETGKIVYDLVCGTSLNQPRPMNIVRVKFKKFGNVMYKTLCIARKIASKVDYSYEILRDYNGFELRQDFDDKLISADEERTARYRIRRRLQPRKCTYTDPQSNESCDCIIAEKEEFDMKKPELICSKCNHIHKQIETYMDINNLPCILILINKGRLGDTFPSSFNVMDLRLCYRNEKTKIYLSCLVQELGRLCRYANPETEPLPYALISERLEKILRDSLMESAVYYGIEKIRNHVEVDPKVKTIKAKTEKENTETTHRGVVSGHHEYGNEKKYDNRLLLEAEPQVGKTGVYLKVIEILRKSKYTDEEENSPEYDEENDYENIEDDFEDDIDEDDKDKFELYSKSSDWLFPYKENMKNAKSLKKHVKGGKHAKVHGDYHYQNTIAEIFPFMSIKKNHAKAKQGSPVKFATEIKAHNYIKHNNCDMCSISRDHIVKEFCLGHGYNFKISVPASALDFNQYESLLRHLECIVTNKTDSSILDKNFSSNINEHPNCLKSWIFIPSYGRAETAYLNYNHTMIDKNKRSCQYISIIVVRSIDFKAYQKLWKSTHAILQIPDKLPHIDQVSNNGGVGFARLCIQYFAEALGLPWIFMLDDNIIYTKTIKENNSQVARKENGNLDEDFTSLFSVLKHIERITEDDALHPYDGTKSLKDYTGGSNKYAVIGIKRFRPMMNVKIPFTKKHVYSLVYLNIKALKEKELRFKPWPIWGQMVLDNDCDEHGLWVCKYNRFTLMKCQMKTWLPEVFQWSENTILSDKPQIPLAANSNDILIRWLCCSFAFPSNKFLILQPVEPNNNIEQVKRKLNEINPLNSEDKHRWLTTAEQSDVIDASSKIYVFLNSKIGNGYRIIILSHEQCLRLKLTKLKRFLKWLNKFWKDVRSQNFKVVTSHDVQKFKVKLVVVIFKADGIKDPSQDVNEKQSIDPATKRPFPQRNKNEDGISVSPSKRLKTNAEDNGLNTVWTDEAIQLLINTVKPYCKEKIPIGTAKEPLWKNVAKSMVDYQYTFQPSKCSKKWKDLKKRYEYLQKKPKWKYFDAMDDLIQNLQSKNISNKDDSPQSSTSQNQDSSYHHSTNCNDIVIDKSKQIQRIKHENEELKQQIEKYQQTLELYKQEIEKREVEKKQLIEKHQQEVQQQTVNFDVLGQLNEKIKKML